MLKDIRNAERARKTILQARFFAPAPILGISRACARYG